MILRGILVSYLSRQFLTRVLAALFAFTALLQLLDLLDAASDVLERGGGVGDIAYYALLRLPVIMDRVLPLAVLMGALLTLLGLAQNNEIVALKSAGLTPYRLLGVLAPAAVGIGLFHFVLADQVVPRAERAFLSWWQESNPPGEEAERGKPVWLRAGGTILRVDRVLDRGRRLEGVELYPRDAAGRMQERITAGAATFEDGAWTLIGAQRVGLRAGGGTEIRREARLPWDLTLHPTNVVEVAAPTEKVPAHRLRTILSGDWSGSNSPAYYRTRLHKTYSGPLASLIMLLLAAPVAHGMRRSGNLAGGLTVGIVAGLLYLLTDGMLAALGEAGAMPAAMAAWGPTALFASIGAAIMVHVEG
ncbi:MAG TPA: LPS export ABC transporter permease LptG [Azospirillaceae bacterium]|nr:LPS export ABC transporter permease LptG [Azospirillaceae bacterium]